MAHSSRKESNQAPQVPENYYDNLLITQQKPTNIIHDILEQIISDGARILHTKYLISQIIPYASKNLARELVMNASWALEPIGPNDVVAEPDEDLEIPPIDEWAGGVLPVRSAEATGLRASAPPPREPTTKSSTTASSIRNAHSIPQNTEKPRVSQPESKSTTSQLSHRSRGPNKQEKEPPKKKPKPPVSEAVAITRAFEEAKKKTAVSMKAVTVDSDFTVIQISEPKGLPPALIVPKVTTKRATRSDQQATSVQRAAPRTIVRPKPQAQQKKRQMPKLIEPDVPIFDEEIAEISYSDKFVPAPGVTFKDGSTVKSRAQQANPNQMTRAQYEAYLEEMKKC